MQWHLRPEIDFPGWMSAGLHIVNLQIWLSVRPSAGRRADFDALPISIRAKSCPHIPFLARTHDCITIQLVNYRCTCWSDIQMVHRVPDRRSPGKINSVSSEHIYKFSLESLPGRISRQLLKHPAEQCFRAVNRPSGPALSLTAAGKQPTSALRPADGWPEG